MIADSRTTQADLVDVRQEGAVLHVDLVAPNGINSLTREVRTALLAALTGPALDPTVRVVVLRGRGRTFCVGQALDEHAGRLADDVGTAFDCVDAEYRPLARAIRALPKPVVAAVDGACAGAGVSLAMACDLRVLSAKSKLTFAFIGIGLTADTGLTAALIQTVGAPRTKAMLMLDQPLSADQALAAGLADVVADNDDFAAELDGIVNRLAAGPTAAYARIKAVVHDAESATFERTLELESEAQRALGLTTDHQVAVSAFLGKQPVVFTGR